MEGSGEGVDVVVRNVKATGLVVTMVSRRVSRQDPPRLAVRRSASTLPLKYIQPRNAWMTATKKLSAPRISSAMQTSAEPKVKVNSGVQAYDDRYLSSYQIAHCKIEPTSPPGYSSEFPAQKVHPCRGGHFTVDTYSCEKTPPKSVRPDIVRNNSKGFDRGCFGQRSNSYQSDAFAHSLRQYSWSRACRTKSVDLMDRLVKYRHMKNGISSKISKSARTIPNKISNLRENRKARRNTRVQTYTRARQDIERESSETPNISGMPQTLPGWRYRKSSGTSTYDYLKPAGELRRKLRDRTFDIRYLDNMAQYMRNPMNSIYLNESKVCPKILSRYNEHKRRNHSVEQANNTNQDWKTQANKNTGCHWPFERESTIQTSGINDKSCSTAPYESAMKYHLAGQGAKATRERTSSGITDESEHPDLKMQFWLDELPVLPNETPEQKLARVREMKHLANTLKDKRIHDKTESLYDRIKNWADKLPFDESVLNNEDINHLKQDITNNLFKKITDIDANPDIFNDSSLYEDVIKDQVDDALNDVQEYVQGDKHKLKKIKDELVNHIKENRLNTLNNMAGKAYKQQLRDAVAETIPSECGATLKEDEVSFDVLKESLADAFINLNYSNNDESLRNKAKKKITEEITKFCNDYLNRHPDLPLSETELNEELYSNLKNVPLPSNDSMKSEVEHVRIKEVINDWMKDLPLEDLSPSEQYQQMRKISILAKNLLDLEKIKNESNNSLVQADMEKEIVKWLTKMPLKTEEKDKSSLENFAQDLISMLKNTESARKFHPSSRLSANATKSPLNEMHSPCLEPPCALSLEDCQLLERIRDRMCSWKSRTARRICKNTGVGSCMDYEGQTDAIEFGCKKSVPSVCPRGFQGSAHIRRTPSCWSPKPSRSCVKRIPSGELRSCCDRRAKRNYNCAARETCGDLQVKEECFWDPPEWSSTTRIPCSNIGQEPCPLYRNTRKSQQSSHKPCGYQRKHVRPAQTCPRENIDLQPQRYRQTRIRDAHLESYNVIRNPSLRLLPSTESSSVRFPIAKFWETPRENIYTSGEDSDAMHRGNIKRLERDCECYGKEPSKPRRKAQTNDRDCRHCSHEPVKNYSRNFAAQCPYPSYLYFRQ